MTRPNRPPNPLDVLLAPWRDHPARIRRLERKMAVTQADLDNLATQLVEDTGLIQTEIQNLRDANPNLDLSGLESAVAQVGQLVPSQTGGGEGPVADDPSAPVVDGSGDGSGSSSGEGTYY